MPQKECGAGASPGLRLLQLYVMLGSSGRTYTLSRLAQLFGCSSQSMLRMMDQLALAPDVKIDSWRDGRVRCYRVNGKGHSTPLHLTAETLRYVALCRDLMRHLLPEPVQRELQDSLGELLDKKRLDAAS